MNEYVERVKHLSGCLLAQLLQSGHERIGMSSWETQETLAVYADGELARALLTRIAPLFLGRPTAGSYEVKRSVSEHEGKKEWTFPMPPFFDERSITLRTSADTLQHGTLAAALPHGPIARTGGK